MRAGATVKVDASGLHPTLVFFQHIATRATVVLERVTGRQVGCWPGEIPPAEVITELMQAVAAYYKGGHGRRTMS